MGDALSVGAVDVSRLWTDCPVSMSNGGLDFSLPHGVLGALIKAGSLKLRQYQIEK